MHRCCALTCAIVRLCACRAGNFVAFSGFTYMCVGCWQRTLGVLLTDRVVLHSYGFLQLSSTASLEELATAGTALCSKPWSTVQSEHSKARLGRLRAQCITLHVLT